MRFVLIDGRVMAQTARHIGKIDGRGQYGAEVGARVRLRTSTNQRGPQTGGRLIETIDVGLSSTASFHRCRGGGEVNRCLFVRTVTIVDSE